MKLEEEKIRKLNFLQLVIRNRKKGLMLIGFGLPISTKKKIINAKSQSKHLDTSFISTSY